jgi:hypothetical protein
VRTELLVRTELQGFLYGAHRIGGAYRIARDFVRTLVCVLYVLQYGTLYVVLVVGRESHAPAALKTK